MVKSKETVGLSVEMAKKGAVQKETCKSEFNTAANIDAPVIYSANCKVSEFAQFVARISADKDRKELRLDS